MTRQDPGATTAATPTKVIVFSADDLPTVPATGPLLLMGVPAVIEHNGEPHLVRSSPYVPAGHAYVIDTAALDFGPLTAADPAFPS